MTYSPKSGDKEKLSIPLEPHHKAQSNPLGKTILHTCSDKTALVQEFKPGQNFSHLFPPVHTCSHLFTPVHTRSHLFTPVHNCSPLFTPVHTYSHLTDNLRSLRNGSFSLNFPLRKLLFFDLTYYLFGIAFFAYLIESYPTVHGLSKCVEKKYIDPCGSPYYIDHVCSSHNVIFALSNALLLQYYVVAC